MWRCRRSGVSGAKRWPFSVDTPDLQVSKQGAEEERHDDLTPEGWLWTCSCGTPSAVGTSREGQRREVNAHSPGFGVCEASLSRISKSAHVQLSPNLLQRSCEKTRRVWGKPPQRRTSNKASVPVDVQNVQGFRILNSDLFIYKPVAAVYSRNTC